MTIIEGFDKSIDIKELAKKLKNKFACGGTSKGNSIELQGDHTKNVKKEFSANLLNNFSKLMGRLTKS